MQNTIVAAFNPGTDKAITLDAVGSWPETKHRFDKRHNLAVKTAIAAHRPLLVRGEPGVGKSQLARAAAQVLGWPFLYHVVAARSEHSDLLYHYDAVSRLAQAQVFSKGTPPEQLSAELAEDRFLQPGVLWWAFDWADARKQAKRWCRNKKCNENGEHKCCPSCCEPDHPEEGEPGDEKKWCPGKGCVVLIDEIDKAESDLPNGLLESFGNNGFQVPHARREVRLEDRVAPLLVVTTNQERELPAAFVRRCVVLQMGLPEDTTECKNTLITLGRDHCSEWISDAQVDGKSVYEKAAEMILQDREAAIREHSPLKPGLAEYLDMLYVLARLYPNDAVKQSSEVDALRQFVFCKFVEQGR